jgi:hypothetical protein
VRGVTLLPHQVTAGGAVKKSNTLVTLPSTLYDPKLTTLPNTPQTQLTVKIMNIERKKFPAQGCVLFALRSRVVEHVLNLFWF